MQKLSAYFSLFASTGTLFCCALPSLLVALGMGATMAGLVSTVPQIIWLSQYKVLVFTISGSLIALSALVQYRTRNDPCSIDIKQAEACARARKISVWSLSISAGIWLLGAFFAFVAPYVLY